MSQKTDITIDEMQSFCKRKGLVYPSSELYGGIAGMFDFGPYGVELKQNIKNSWWFNFVTRREDIVGMDGAIISHEDIWRASGHLSGFNDIMVTCSKCGEKVRADQYIEEQVEGIVADGMNVEQINTTIKEHDLTCPKCKSEFKEATKFNLMFPVNVGAGTSADATGYLRGETAQLIFTDFRLVTENARLKPPFGIAQMGKAFRNEISPRNFLFRCREFEQMEIEYFIHPRQENDCPFIDEVHDMNILVLREQEQVDEKDAIMMTVKDILNEKTMNVWHMYWFAKVIDWFVANGVNPEHFRLRQHLKTELSHYSKDTWDLEYKFPFGWKELMGIANRTDFDLQSHIKQSKKDLGLYDEESKEKFVPHVIAEPSMGFDRAFLVFMFEAYHEDKERGNTVLHFASKLAPIKVGIFPLVKKAGLPDIAKKLRDEFAEDGMNVMFDMAGSIGKRYARMDEIGTPYCLTVDFETLGEEQPELKDTITIRDRDSTEQKRIPLSDAVDIISKLIKGKMKFSDL